VFLLITFFENARQRRKEGETEVPNTFCPTVATIVPCWNEEKTVSGTINSLLALNYPKNKFEIIVVNDGSTDNTRAVLAHFKDNPQITIVHKENGGKHSAMNEALKYTNAEFIGCLDADSYVEKDALTHIVSHFDNLDVVAVTPSIKIHQAKSALQLAQRAEYGLAVFVRKTFTLVDALFITPGPFSFFRRDVLDEIGHWKYAHGTEDLEMCLRLQLNQKKIENEPRAIVHTTAPQHISQLFNQRVRWTYGFFKNALAYRTLFFNPKYGTLGMFVLPLTLFTLLTTLFLPLLFLWNSIVFALQEIVRFQTIGITSPFINFDVFFVDTNIGTSVTLILLIVTFLLVGMGRRMTKDSFLSLDVPLFLLIYGFITPVWLTASLYKVATSKRVKWR